MFSKNEILQFALENGMIDESTIQEKMEMNERKKYLEKHPYKIWKGKDGKWYTYLPDEIKGRRLLKKSTEQKIENGIIDFWKKEEENPTVKQMYEEWVNLKLEREEISYQTKNRYDRQFNECMGTFAEERIKKLNPIDIEDFVLYSIHENSLTQKGYSNLRTLIYGIFRRAKKKGFVSFSITEVIKDMEISPKLFRKIIREDNELVFMEDEVPKIIDYLMNRERDLIDLGILLLFKSGLRPGELAGLEKQDIAKNIIHVCRTEIRYSTSTEKNIYEVRDFPKTEAGKRDTIIPEHCMWIIKEILKQNPFGKYLFEIRGKRIRTYQFSQRLETICRRTGIIQKSPNKIRKTYASILFDANVEESVITSQMGHTDIKTTKTHYYKNRKTQEQKVVLINNVAGL